MATSSQKLDLIVAAFNTLSEAGQEALFQAALRELCPPATAGCESGVPTSTSRTVRLSFENRYDTRTNPTGNGILPAIKAFRAALGFSLKGAKDAIDGIPFVIYADQELAFRHFLSNYSNIKEVV